MLSPKLLLALRAHWRFYHWKSSNWLFPSNYRKDQPIDTKTVWHACQKAAKHAGIQKSVHPHTLRHCFDTQKGNRNMRRILNQAANAAVKAKELSLRSSIVVWYRAWDINKLSGWLRIGSVSSSGCSSTRDFVTKNGARQSPNNPSKGAPPR
jgi:integrase-like protein